MSRLRIQGALFALILFAAVALFPSVANVGSPKAGNLSFLPPATGTTGMLTADGGAPPPIPYSLAA